MHPQRQELWLKRRLNRWQILFIALGGIIGIGFFRGSSKSLAIAGPVGALVAVVVVGAIATSVMECICELVILWPIPNAMVEYVKVFVDEDLGVAVGIMYWYTYCVNFSALIIAATDLTDYWGVNEIFKVVIYVMAPIGLMIINAFPVELFGWIEFFGGIAKLALVVGTIILMFLVNGGVNPDGLKIGATYFVQGITHNNQVASTSYQAVFEAIPLATFAYIGVELVTTTAFEARDPKELRLPAANVGWISTVLYGLATGSFVANVSWQDQNLPQLFQQALTIITNPEAKIAFAEFKYPAPDTNAAPLIALYRVGYRFLPSFLNGCFIYSALSCANTALYVASRQLYGMTRTITIDRQSSIFRRGLRWVSNVHPQTKSPWTAIAISALLLCWLPFIRVHDGNSEYLQDVQDALIAIGSVSCILMWCSQCIAYIMFYHLRDLHEDELQQGGKWEKLFDANNKGNFSPLQPFFGYLGALCTIMVVFFFNTASLWNGDRISVKAVSAFVSPALVLAIWIIKKVTRRDRRFKFFVNSMDFRKFERRLQTLEDLIYPGEDGTASSEGEVNMGPIHNQHLRPVHGGVNGTANRSQNSFAPIHESENNNDNHRPPSFNRTNITLAPSRDNLRQGHSISELTHPAAVDATRTTDVENHALADRTRMPYAQSYSPALLSPSSASSRGALGNIYETEG